MRFAARLYRNRADAENGFNELKNRWGAFTAQGLKRYQHMSRPIALICKWWGLFVPLKSSLDVVRRRQLPWRYRKILSRP